MLFSVHDFLYCTTLLNEQNDDDDKDSINVRSTCWSMVHSSHSHTALSVLGPELYLTGDQGGLTPRKR